jgi:CBS domain containing-hemolysin-like protein
VESIVLILACLLGSAFFSGSETALLRLRRSDVETEVERATGPAAFAIRDLLGSTSRLLVTILLGNNVVNILGATVASAVAVGALGPELGITVATVVMTVTVLVFCEVLPKAMAVAHPQGFSRVVALPLYLFHRGLRPVHALFSLLVDPLVRRAAGSAAGGEVVSVEDVVSLVRQAEFEERGGGVASIIAGAARAAEMTAHEIMVDRAEIVAYPVETAPEELFERMLEERYTRIPVYEGSIDRFAGIVHFKDLVRYVRSGGHELRQILRPVLQVPERKAILPLLAEMQRGFVHVAIVKDEHGITQGLLTSEDILEELVGEIRDEYDREELQSIRRRGEGFEALGRVKVLDFNRETGWDVTAERGDTLSGLVFNDLGRAPHAGDVVRLPGYEVEVAELSGPRIARVWLRRVETMHDETP